MAETVLTIKGLDELIERFSDAPEIVDREIDRAMQRSVQKLQTDVKVGTPVDTGRLRGSITGQVSGRGLETKGLVGTKVQYAPYVEYGTAPHFPPLGALEVWARRHGKTAWGVALKIAAFGTRPREMFKRAFEKNVGWIQDEFGKVAERILEELGK